MIAQEDDTHASVAAWVALHTVPGPLHPPQCAGSYLVSTHAPLQGASGDAQLAAQTPLEQTWPAEHFMPHAPQLFGSDTKAVQNAAPPVPQAFGVAVGQLQVLDE